MQQKGQTDIPLTARASSQVQVCILRNPNEKRVYFLSSISALHLDTISKIQTSCKNSQKISYTHYSDSLMANILPICFIFSSLSPSLTRTCEHTCVQGCRHTHIHTHTHTQAGMIIPITLKYLVYILRMKTFFLQNNIIVIHIKEVNISILFNKTHIFQSMNSSSPSVQFSLLSLNCIQLSCFFSLL